MKKNNLYIDPVKSGYNHFIYVGSKPYFKYVDGKREEQEGTTIIVACPTHGLDKLNVKIPGRKEFDDLREMSYVHFKNLEMKIWQDFHNGNKIQFSCKAEEVAEVKNNNATKS